MAALEERVIENERSLYKMDQHSRKVNFLIDGIPQTVDQVHLKDTAVKIFEEAGVAPVSVRDVEVIHRLNSKKSPQPTIIKAKRDFIDRVFEKRKEMINVADAERNY